MISWQLSSALTLALSVLPAGNFPDKRLDDMRHDGISLHSDLEKEYIQLQNSRSLTNRVFRNDVTSIFIRYISIGISISETKFILTSGGFELTQSIRDKHYIYCGLTLEEKFLWRAQVYRVIYSEAEIDNGSSTVSTITAKLLIDSV
jgi:hypothetical protein